MEKKYSIYEARAKFSELVRTVLASGSVLITQRGIPVIRLVSYQASQESLEAKLADMVRAGRVRPASRTFANAFEGTKKLVVKSGALARFLKDRDD